MKFRAGGQRMKPATRRKVEIVQCYVLATGGRLPPRRCASQQKMRADVADGSDSVLGPRRLNVRFARKRTRPGDTALGVVEANILGLGGRERGKRGQECDG